MLIKSLLHWVSAAQESRRLSVFIFHRVLAQQDPLFPNEMHARRFDALCAWLASWFTVLPLDQAIDHLKAGSLPARAACMTFDDGYADNYQIALPILARHKLTATFFIATGFMDGGRMWNDSLIETIRHSPLPMLDLSRFGLGCYDLHGNDAKGASIAALIHHLKYRHTAERVELTQDIANLAEVTLPLDLMMTSQQVIALRDAGMQVGAHTQTHPILARLTDKQVRKEIQASQAHLENLLGERIRLFAYPNGKPGQDYTPRCVAVVRDLGFDGAVSTQWGASATGDDLYQIRRFTPWDANRLQFGLRLLKNLKS
jgi:peptidoglycan/xylan/chitin deacetylase (PgdA/CDA1 family)